MEKDYVVVTAISQFRMRYVMHRDDLQALNPDKPVNMTEWACDTVTCCECHDFSQEHLGETIIEARCIDEDEMVNLFNSDNDYLASWSREKKIEFVRDMVIKVNKEDEEQ